ncbi:MAG: hypothetical protein M5U34_46195 [Chloroflexi bacterium]|nr:hypothetical protein [Chloroflexota bacterium]
MAFSCNPPQLSHTRFALAHRIFQVKRRVALANHPADHPDLDEFVDLVVGTDTHVGV